VPLKKPKEFYTIRPNTSLDEVRESATPERVETISGAFNAFKTNLNHVQSISDFTNKFDTFEANIEKVEALSESVEGIRENIQELIKKEDLDSAMTAHLLFVEESIRSVQDKVKTVNCGNEPQDISDYNDKKKSYIVKIDCNEKDANGENTGNDKYKCNSIFMKIEYKPSQIVVFT